MAFAAPPESTLSMGMKTNYREEMIALGAQLITDGGKAQTATAAIIDHSSDVSVLRLIGSNVSSAYSKCLGWVALFMGEADGDYQYLINSDFFESSLDADSSRVLMEMWQGGAISKDVLDKNLIAGKVIPEDTDLDIMNGAIASELPPIDLNAESN